MRDIIFRGKRSDNGEWVKGFLHKNKGAFFLYIDQIEFINEDIACNTYKVVDETVGQSTGKSDKNGVNIYEDDFIKDKWGDLILIKWANSGFYPYRYTGKYNKVTNWNNVIEGEIVGNLYDTPELLDGKQ